MSIKMGKYQQEYYNLEDMDIHSPMQQHKDADEADIKIDDYNAMKESIDREARLAKLARDGSGWGDFFDEEPQWVEDSISEAVSGSHYNDVVPGFQYMEMMQYMLADKYGVEAHLLGQVYKYLMRSGRKDDIEQEYRKARWYLNCLIKYKQTGKIDPNNND